MFEESDFNLQRESCPKGGRGRECFDWGGTGHFSRECPNPRDESRGCGRDGRGNAWFKFNERDRRLESQNEGGSNDDKGKFGSFQSNDGGSDWTGKVDGSPS